MRSIILQKLLTRDIVFCLVSKRGMQHWGPKQSCGLPETLWCKLYVGLYQMDRVRILVNCSAAHRSRDACGDRASRVRRLTTWF